MSLSPHNLNQKGSTGEIHDGRPDKDHEVELRKAGEEKHQAHEDGEKEGREPHE